MIERVLFNQAKQSSLPYFTKLNILPFMRRLILIFQKPIHSLHLVLKPLPLIRPRPHADVTLNAHNPIRVEHAVRLTYDLHHFVP